MPDRSEKYIKNALKHLPANATESQKDFHQMFYGKVSGEDRHKIASEDIYNIVQKHWDLMKSQKKGEFIVDIGTHNPDEDGTITAHSRTTIDIISPDMAFLVDSITAKLTQDYKLIYVLVHPIIHIKTDKKNRIIGVSKHADDTTVSHTHFHIELHGLIPDGQHKTLKADLLQILDDVKYATQDWQEMKSKLRDAQKSLSLAPPDKYKDDEIEEYLYFLEYMYQDNFTLLGYREYKLTEKNGNIDSRTVKGSSLGLLHDGVQPVYMSDNDSGLSKELQKVRYDLPPLSVSKINKKSTVHRPVPLDAIAVKRFDKKGNIVGECLFIGLFTSVTYSRSIQDIPLLRRKADMAMRQSGSLPHTHDYKALKHILEKYPRDELFQIDIDHLLEIAVSILRLQERQRIALYTRNDPFGRYISCLVYVPRDRYDTDLRVEMEQILEAELGGYVGGMNANMDDSPFARLLFTVYTEQGKTPKFNARAIEKQLQEAGRLWSEKLTDALYQELDSDQEITNMLARYGNAFPSNYADHYTPKQAYYDILNIEECLATDTIALDLYQCKYCADHQLRLKIFNKNKPVPLTSILPVLENMGLKAISEVPYEVKPHGEDNTIWIHDFVMDRDEFAQDKDIDEIKEVFEEALIKIWYDRMEDDGLNLLVVGAGMPWRDIVILRAFVRYMRQGKMQYGLSYIEKSLTNHPKIAAELVAFFKTKFDPDNQKNVKERCAGHIVAVDHALENVSVLDEDRILRTIMNMIDSALRTNFFQTGEDGQPKDHLSIKFDSNRIENIPLPKPFREIFVYSPRVEGVHLRGASIARGGLRWSDRHEDFRTEILDLMKAQQVKNSVIVPMGAKGGFIVKNPPSFKDRKAFQEEGIACYKIFIHALLDITDNMKGNRIIGPKKVVRPDGNDPYFVVAADKGTATFSDIANEISMKYDFWLDDAFASGGSAGYDHKAMGITARGAWESVKRHFRELNHDTQTAPFRAIGVGDMGGDVFGNGMLLSDQIRLIGAFNHLHIFCDPDPDPASSFKERKRLFEKVAGWDQYNTKKLSKGGRIFSRSEKSLDLTPEIMEAFGIENKKVTPMELMRAMLKANTDLLWFGGIGTYIKASNETHAQVGDKGNDALRVDASEVTARVIGEGANLGVTQKGRIEFAKRGGRLNADFIDNSGGVDCSDHEVNIKILLTDIVKNERYKMTRVKRDNLLERMTEEVAALVLNDNYQQAQGISMTEIHAAEHFGIHMQFIEKLEKEDVLDRTLANLPDDDEVLERANNGKGLTRPEIGILHSYAKIKLTERILSSDLPDNDNIYDEWLVKYFPAPLQKKYVTEIKNHRLCREIVSTTLSNSIVNRMGPVYVDNIMERTGATAEQVAKAYLIVREAFQLKHLWSEIEALDNKAPSIVQLDAMNETRKLIERGTIWFLTRYAQELDVKDDVKTFKTSIDLLRSHIDNILTEDLHDEIQQKTEAGMRNQLSADLAYQIALLPVLGSACDITRIHKKTGFTIPVIARTFLEVGERFHLNWLQKQAAYLQTDSNWSEEALEAIVEQFYVCQAMLTSHILHDCKTAITKKKLGQKDQMSVVETWLDKQGDKLTQLDSTIHDMRRSGTLDIPMLIIAEQRLRTLYSE